MRKKLGTQTLEKIGDADNWEAVDTDNGEAGDTNGETGEHR